MTEAVETQITHILHQYITTDENSLKTYSIALKLSPIP